MSKSVLIVFAHPEPQSLTRQLVDVAAETLAGAGHHVSFSDLYAMGWDAVYRETDFPRRVNPERLSFVHESFHAFATGSQPAVVKAEQDKVFAADAVLFQFPLWWFSAPAILKGWFDRVWACGLAYNYKNEGNRLRYGEGPFAGKRALVSVTTGGPATDYAPRGINGPLDELLFPLLHGTLFFPGFSVLPLHAIYGTAHISAEDVASAKAAWRARVERLFDEAPIGFRLQNGGDYPDHHTLADHAAPGRSGITAHIAGA